MQVQVITTDGHRGRATTSALHLPGDQSEPDPRTEHGNHPLHHQRPPSWVAARRSLRGTAPSPRSSRCRCCGLNVATGEVLTDYRKRHTAVDLLSFFKLIDKQVDRDLDIHVVLDNLSAHKAPEVTEWLARPAQQRWHLHFIPTSSSWLNLIECWFKELTDRRLRRGTITRVPDLIDAMRTWTDNWNKDPKPFIWHKTAEEIIEKVGCGRSTLSQVKSATHH